mgnify:CR=1 FL=1
MKIVTKTELSAKDIESLIKGELLAIRIPNFSTPDTCRKLSNVVTSDTGRINYKHDLIQKDGSIKTLDYGVETPSIPFTWVAMEPDNLSLLEQYLTVSEKQQSRINVAIGFDENPVRRCIGQLAKAWHHGIEIARHKGRLLHPGLLRLTLPNAVTLNDSPHIDSLLHPSFNQSAQLSMNIYLSTPEHGGELIVWDIPPLLTENCKTFETDDNMRKILQKKPCYKIRPEEGELILINTRIPHAVSTFQNGCRVSQQAFIGVKDSHSPLYVWS